MKIKTLLNPILKKFFFTKKEKEPEIKWETAKLRKLVAERDIIQKRINKAMVLSLIFAFIIAITPLISYSYLLVTKAKTWDTFFGTVESNYFESAQVFMWVFLGKFIPLLLCVIWFFTNKQWWYHVLIIPIGMFTYQLVETIASDTRFFDNKPGFLIFFMIVTMIIIYFARVLSAYYKLILGLDLKELERQRKDLNWTVGIGYEEYLKKVQDEEDAILKQRFLENKDYDFNYDTDADFLRKHPNILDGVVPKSYENKKEDIDDYTDEIEDEDKNKDDE